MKKSQPKVEKKLSEQIGDLKDSFWSHLENSLLEYIDNYANKVPTAFDDEDETGIAITWHVLTRQRLEWVKVKMILPN